MTSTIFSLVPGPGHPVLLQHILAAVRSAATPAASPVDPVVLQALLACLVAQDAHPILRTNEEDINPIFRLVVWILSSVFGYTTHKLKIRPGSRSSSHPAAHNHFLRSLFLPPSPSASGSQDESSEPNKPRRVGPRRPRMSPISPTYMDSPSLSNVSSSSPTALHVKSPDSGSHHHSHLGNNPHSGNSPSPQLPRAIVISGLENAATSSQRALAQVLSEKRILFDSFRDDRRLQDGRHDLDAHPFHGTWNLPDGFIFVYVCPIDSRERPSLHNALLDKFAMSCNVFLKPHIRNILQPVPLSPTIRTNSGPHSTTPSASLATSHNKPPVQSRHSHSHSGSHLPILSTPVLPPAFLNSLREACTKTHLSPTLSLYLADLFSATRHHAQMDGTLLTARCVRDAEKLTRAARVIGVDPTGVELLRGGEDEYEADGLPEDEGSENSQWQVPEDELEATGVTGSLRHSTSSLIRGRETPSSDTQSSAVALDVTEVNIARVFPRCVSHRLRVRDGPREEVLAGAVFGATFGDSFAEDTGTEEMYVDTYEARPTVKDILISIMSEV